MDSKRSSDQQQIYDALRREKYRERMRKYDEEYYAAREKREEEEAKEEQRRQNRKVSEREERFNFLTKLFGVFLFGGFGVGVIYVGIDDFGQGLIEIILSVLAIALGICFLIAAWQVMGKRFSDSGKQDIE
jgi:hypothetical protein